MKDKKKFALNAVLGGIGAFIGAILIICLSAIVSPIWMVTIYALPITLVLILAVMQPYASHDRVRGALFSYFISSLVLTTSVSVWTASVFWFFDVQKHPKLSIWCSFAIAIFVWFVLCSLLCVLYYKFEPFRNLVSPVGRPTNHGLR
jgi:hypothetical protein